MYPVMLCVRDRRCLVVGGGGVAFRKVEALVAEGALVTVVAPDPDPHLRGMADAGAVRVEERRYLPGEAAGYALVFAATDDADTNRLVAGDAEAAGVWVNVADDPQLCAFQLPSRVRRGALEVALGSSGGAPFAVRRLRQMLERRLGLEWGEWMDAAARFRVLVRAGNAAPGVREELYDRFFEATVDPGRLTARVPGAAEMEGWLAEGTPRGTDRAAADRADVPPPSGGAARGFVSLVGAGPGNPGLLTLRGRARLLSADAVVYDRLAAPALPPDLPPGVELHCVGKEAGEHPVPQEEISALLVRLAGAGKRVVRLKGGDPFVFGRGGEEAEALVAVGIPFEVIPGVTAGVAVPAYAGIPVTHRRDAVRVSFVTAHECLKEDGPQLRWELMAHDPHATVVGYMGVRSLPLVVSRLLEAGMDPETGAAVVERGGTSAQRVVRTTLAALPGEVLEARVRPPALFVIGPTVERAGRLEWFSRRPLAGERLVVTASRGGLAEELDLAGAETLVVPLPVTAAAEVAIAALPLTGLVLGSALEVEALEAVHEGLVDEAAVAWCIGAETAACARRRGWRVVEELDEREPAEGIVAAIAERRGALLPA
jgi:uroporphyrin-III C-methyltransferase/precorrin-2 dehydrogenase/sirohydrochlorin ferrochelatase